MRDLFRKWKLRLAVHCQITDEASRHQLLLTDRNQPELCIASARVLRDNALASFFFKVNANNHSAVLLYS